MKTNFDSLLATLGASLFFFTTLSAQEAGMPELVLIRGDTFQMGGTKKADGPIHEVVLSDFYLGKHEVTFEEYDRYCEAEQLEKPTDDGWGRGSRPAIYVSWHDAIGYCNWLSRRHGYEQVYSTDGAAVTANWEADGFRLPTEAEWEFAARSGGQDERWAGVSYEKGLYRFGNYDEGGERDGYRTTSPVGSFQPNGLGLYDLSGNVNEWCWDWYDAYYYEVSPASDPRGPDAGQERVMRGGSWIAYANTCQTTHRRWSKPDHRYNFIGFRVCRKGE